MRGRFISVEGLDGTGKTTVCAALAERLRAHGIVAKAFREPGGTAVGESIRTVLADPATTLSPRAELLLFQAARAELVETQLRPTLDSGAWVLLDRFADSTLAYQGAGRDLGDDVVRAATALATDGLAPDRTLLLRAPSAVRASRLAARGGAAERLEATGADFVDRAERRYEALLRDEPGRVRAIDATPAAHVVVDLAWDAVADLLPSSVAVG